nr:hypothetical protein [Paenibacillus humicola]
MDVRTIRKVWKKFAVGGHVTVTVRAKGIRTRIRRPLRKGLKIILIVNNQFTDAANSTQIASGAGKSSASGSNAAIASSNTGQQHSVGAGGTASNTGMEGTQSKHKGRGKRRRRKHRSRLRHSSRHKHSGRSKRGGRRSRKKEDLVIVLNNKVHEANGDTTAATQLASGGKDYSAGGTNAAIESSNTKQQQGVGGGPGAQATNSGLNSDQIN